VLVKLYRFTGVWKITKFGALSPLRCGYGRPLKHISYREPNLLALDQSVWFKFVEVSYKMLLTSYSEIRTQTVAIAYM